ncbi:histidinol dehydrogenase [Weeksellaceae bacterium TAE3-ERU29]|nr:histidinol dehydrogenase [Weeksellaceae bacterium TAE3-ERU29]
MKLIKNPPRNNWESLTTRPKVNQKELTDLVESIFEEIKENGDNAVLNYGRKFDFPNQKSLFIEENKVAKAIDSVPEELKKAIQLAKENIEKFHLSQQTQVKKIETTPGVICWREARPIEKVGIYIPGGTAPLFSTVLMLAIPAKIAGCKEIVLCTPPNKNGEIHPAILYTAKLTGVTKIYAVGGIQAIGAMTFGTESIPRVNKIFGPGNQYVTSAKQMAQFYGTAIDMPAGPSELLIIADATSNPAFVASDLLSQAEHGVDSQVVLLSTNENVIKSVQKEIELQLAKLPRKEIAKKALENSQIIYFENIKDCVDFSNLYAPEHLILAVENFISVSEKIINAGSVFLGNYSCESAGDYASGTNHTLPTSAYARAYSGVSLDSFIKKITFQELTEQGIQNIGKAIEIMAETEDLFAHRNAVSIRLQDINTKNSAL